VRERESERARERESERARERESERARERERTTLPLELRFMPSHSSSHQEALLGRVPTAVEGEGRHRHALRSDLRHSFTLIMSYIIGSLPIEEKV